LVKPSLGVFELIKWPLSKLQITTLPRLLPEEIFKESLTSKLGAQATFLKAQNKICLGQSGGLVRLGRHGEPGWSEL